MNKSAKMFVVGVALGVVAHYVYVNAQSRNAPQ